MSPKRFLIALGLLIAVLFALDFGVNAALDRISQSSTQSSFVIYDDQGHALYAYTGELSSSLIAIRPNTSPVEPHILHRT